jgi:hypothetical protein
MVFWGTGEIMFKRGLMIITLIGALMAIGFELYAARGFAFLESASGLLITLWTLLPYLTLMSGYYFFEHPRIQKQWLSFSLFEVFIVGWFYFQAMVIYPDAQSSLIFLFLPVWQGTLNMLVGILLYWLQARLNRAH